MALGAARSQWTAPVGPGSGSAGPVVVAVVVAAGASALVLVGFDALAPPVRAWLLVGALVAWVVVVVSGRLRGGLPLAPVIAGIALTIGGAVATPSNQSLDVFSYAMYGRMVAVHHENPYESVPADFPDDPIRPLVGRMWQRTPDIYGPAFTAVMVVATPVVGTSPLRVRLVYQVLAAGALVLVLVALWRMTRSALALAVVGLNPLTTVSVVNGGHPDVLVALALLGALVLAIRRRPVACGLVLAAAAAVNATALVAAAAVAAWALRRWRRDEVVRLAAVVAGLGVLPYLLLPGWLANAHEHQELVSRQSAWRAASILLVDLGPLGKGDLDAVMPLVTRAALAVLVLLVLVRRTRAATPAFAMAAALGAFVVTSPWVMPWYAFAALPLLALDRPGLLVLALGGSGGLVLAGDQLPRLSVEAGAVPAVLLSVVMPIAAAVAVVVAISRRPAAEVPRPAAPVAVG